VLSRILWEVTNSSPSDSEGIRIPTESPSVIGRTPSLRVDRHTPRPPKSACRSVVISNCKRLAIGPSRIAISLRFRSFLRFETAFLADFGLAQDGQAYKALGLCRLALSWVRDRLSL
jgi:hypothetical protein